MSTPSRRITFKVTRGEAAALAKLVNSSPKWASMQHFVRLAVVDRIEDEQGPIERRVR